MMAQDGTAVNSSPANEGPAGACSRRWDVLAPVGKPLDLGVEVVALTSVRLGASAAWFAVSAEGEMRVGAMPADDGPMAGGPPRRLDGFDPDRDRVLGLYPRPGLFGAQHEVYVIVRRSSPEGAAPEARCYRVGVRVGLDGRPVALSSPSAPAHGARSTDLLAPEDLKHDELPEVLRAAMLHGPDGVDLPASAAQGAIQWSAAPDPRAPLPRLAWDGAALWSVGADGELTQLCGASAPAPVVALRREIVAAAVLGSGRPTLVLSTDDEWLIGARLDGDDAQVEWRHRLDLPATALTTARDPERASEAPDLLAATGRGELVRLRLLDAKGVRRDWLERALPGLANAPSAELREAAQRLRMAPRAAQDHAELAACAALAERGLSCADWVDRDISGFAEDLIEAAHPAGAELASYIVRLLGSGDLPDLATAQRVLRELYREARYDFQEVINAFVGCQPAGWARGDAGTELADKSAENLWTGDQKAPDGRSLQSDVDFVVRRALIERCSRVPSTGAPALFADGESAGLFTGTDWYCFEEGLPVPLGALPASWAGARFLTHLRGNLYGLGTRDGFFTVGERHPVNPQGETASELARHPPPPGLRCVAAAPVRMGADACVLLLHSGGGRTVLDLLRIRDRRIDGAVPAGEPALSLESLHGMGGLVLPRLSEGRELAVLALGAEGFLCAVGGPENRRVERFEWKTEAGFVSLPPMWVESGVTALGFVLGEQPRLLVGTRLGQVWSREACGAGTYWVHRPRRRVRSLDVNVAGIVLVTCDPSDVCLLDAEGSRVARERLPVPVRGARWLDGERAAVVGTDGELVVLRSTHRDAPVALGALTQRGWDGTSASGPVKQRAELLLRGLDGALTAQDVPKLDRELGRYLFERLGQVPARAGEGSLLAAASLRELGAFAAHLGQRPGAREAAPWLSVLEEVAKRIPEVRDGDDGSDAQRAAVAILLDAAASTELPVSVADELLDAVPDWLWGDPWVALAGCRLWAADVPLEGPPGELGDAALGALHRLPARAALWLEALLPDAALGELVRSLAAAALSSLGAARDKAFGVGAAPRPGSEDLPGELASAVKGGWGSEALSGPLGQAVLAALELSMSRPGARPEWTMAAGWLGAGLAPEDAPATPLGRLASASRRRLTTSPPVDEAPLGEQVQVLRDAVLRVPPFPEMGRHVGDEHPTAAGGRTQTGDGWPELEANFCRRVDAVVRDVLFVRLRELSLLTRVQPRLAGQTRLGEDRVRLRIGLRPEGARRIEKVRLKVSAAGPGGLIPLARPPTHEETRESLAAGDPELLIELEGRHSPGQATVRVHVELHASDQDPYLAILDCPLDKPPTTSSGPRQLQLPPEYETRLASGLRLPSRGVVVVSCGPVPDEAFVCAAYTHDSNTRFVPLDPRLADLGPGRRYERGLTGGAVLRAVNDLDPREHGTQGRPLLAANGAQRVVVRQALDTITRILHPEAGPLGPEVLGFLRQHAEERRTPALVLLCSAELAGPLRRRIGAAAELRVAARAVELARVEQEKALAGKVTAGLADLLARAETADLRELEAAARAGRFDASAPSAWAEADLSALDVERWLAALALAVAWTEVPKKELEPGHVSAEQVVSRTTKKGNRAKVLAHTGEVLEGRDVERLRNALQHGEWVRVRGFSLLRPWSVNPPFDLLQRLLPPLTNTWPELVGLGYALRSGQVICLAPSYLTYFDHLLGLGRAEGAFSLHQALERGGVTSRLWEEAPLQRLAGLDATGWAALFGDSPAWAERIEALRAWLLLGTGGTPGGDARGVLQIGRWLAPGVNLQEEPTASRSLSVLAKGPVAALRATKSTTAGGDVAFLGGALAGLDDAALDAAFPPPATNGRTPAGPTLRVLLGKDGAGGDHTLCLGEPELRSLLRSPDPGRLFWQTAQLRTRGAALSPFRTSAALPEGSVQFVGREREITQLLLGLRTQSFLILGARRIGKTSLLNRVSFELRRGEVLHPLKLDLQGCDSQQEFLNRLRIAWPVEWGPPPAEDARSFLAGAAGRAKARGRRLVMLLNEIDDLLEKDSRFVATLRGLSEELDVPLVLVGYLNAYDALNTLDSPLYHTAQGPSGLPYMNLGLLSREDVATLLQKLTEPPVGFEWESERVREWAVEKAMERTYGLPWVAAQFAEDLVRAVARGGLARVTATAVDHVVATRRAVLDEVLRELDLGSLLGKPRSRTHAGAVRFVLYALAWKLYFRGGRPPVHDADLGSRSTRDFTFSAREARLAVDEALLEVGARDAERLGRLDTFLRTVETDTLLGRLSLSVLVNVEDLRAVERRYVLRNHILPLELRLAERAGGEDVLTRLRNAAADML